MRHERVFVVGGIRDVDAFDGALVGERVGGELRYRGVVEWGFHAADVLELVREARYARERVSPFAAVAGGWLRAPVWRGLAKR